MEDQCSDLRDLKRYVQKYAVNCGTSKPVPSHASGVTAASNRRKAEIVSDRSGGGRVSLLTAGIIYAAVALPAVH